MKYFNPPRDNLKGKQKDIMDQSKKIASFDRYWLWHGMWHSHRHLSETKYTITDLKRLRHLKLQILLHYFRNFFLFPFFLFKFLLPSFMKGKNNVWKNIKTIIKEKEFKPLRIAILSQFVFTLILTQLGILVYQYYTNPSRTATMFFTQTNWLSGASTTLFAIHPTDLTSWNYFYSTSSVDVDTSVSGQISITPTLNSTTQTTDSDFNSWSKPSNVYIPTGGNKITLLKPNGASCTTGTHCSSGDCTGNVCIPPPCTGSNWSMTYSGISYPFVLIGTQCWFAKNLNIGTMLASVSTLPSNNSVIEKWCYNNSTANCTTYGGLYTWAEANQLATTCNTTSCTPSTPSQGICPSGWHIPTDAEFKTLEMYLGMSQVEADTPWERGTDQGTKLKSGGSSGFNALMSGNLDNTSNRFYYWLNSYTNFWLASEINTTYSISRQLYISSTKVTRYMNGWFDKTAGFSVRCLKN